MLFGRTALALFCAFATLPGLAQAQIDSCAPGDYDFVITVDWALDNLPDSSNHTCDYNTNIGGNYESHPGLFFPAADGKCTLRRAIRQAGAMASSGVDVPDPLPTTNSTYLINFTGLNGTNADGDDAQYDPVADQWTLPIDSGSSANDHFKIDPQGLTDIEGKIAICGPALLTPSGLPKVFIDTSTTLEVEMERVVIRRLGFFGGIGVHFKESFASFRDNMWGLTRDGQEISVSSAAAALPLSLAGPHGVNILPNAGSTFIIRDNVFAGAATKAIEVHSGNTGVEIYDNYIGTRIDGTVPVVPAGVQCETFTELGVDCEDGHACPNPLDWYGGWGISVGGTGAMVHDNVIAGMQNIRSTFDTPPGALAIVGADHIVEDNWIGQGADASAIGTCGQGIQYSGTGHLILNNLLKGVRNGFENTKGAILWSDNTATGAVVWDTSMVGNLKMDCEAPDACTGSTEKLFELSAEIDDGTKTFKPGKITSWMGTSITGENGVHPIFGVQPCPNCRIDFYSDDLDMNEEAFQYLGFTTALADGTFTHTLAAPLAPGLGIRTMSTATDDNVIPRTLAGFTSVASELYTEDSACPTTLVVDGPTVSGPETYAAANTVTMLNFTAEATATVEVIAGTSVVIQADTSIGGTFTVSLEPNCGTGGM